MSSFTEKFYRLAFGMSLSGVLVFLADFGLTQSETSQAVLSAYYFLVLFVGVLSTSLRYALDRSRFLRKAVFFDLLSVFFSLGLFYLEFVEDEPWGYRNIHHDKFVKAAVLLSFVRELAELRLHYRRSFLNPSQLFIGSFLSIILFGTGALLLPKATVDGISFIDALFTATSAVCITGLVVVDTGTVFTEFGLFILLVLIQIGALGLLTFASYFSYFFRGNSSYENQLALSDIGDSKTLSEVFSMLKRILLITFSVELLTGIGIYFFTPKELFTSSSEHLFFSVFHAVSAFCNAGFCTFSDSLYEESIRFNYGLQLTVACSFLVGSLGFPIVSNFFTYLRHSLKRFFCFQTKRKQYKPWVINLNSRINLITTSIILVLSFFLFFFFEYSNSLAEHESFFGKGVIALLGAATPRSSGFNSVDTAALTAPALMLIFVLMWIGGSPSSLGGGVRTSTIAIAVLNIVSLARGKTRIEIFRREIAQLSVQKAFAIIIFSLFMISMGIMFLSAIEQEKDFVALSFECFSAYCTVGLSLGVTGDLSVGGKIIIIMLMFIGRVSMLSLVAAVFRKVKYKDYRYPSEKITIT